MKIVIISDTHTLHHNLTDEFELPEADVLVHAGDISGRGSENDIRKFLKWLGELKQFKHKVFIAGNHDFLFEQSRIFAIDLVNEYAKKYDYNGDIHYLDDSETIIDGIKFWGTPYQKPFFDWAFNKPEEKLAMHWSMIPDDTDVLITHTPPYEIMDLPLIGGDNHTGSPSLRKEVLERIKPKIHCFGHIHEEYGEEMHDNTLFVNASVLDHRYRMTNKPVVVEI